LGDARDGVDVALEEVAAETGAGEEGAFEVNAGVLLEVAEVGAAEGFGGDADFEGGWGGEGRYG